MTCPHCGWENADTRTTCFRCNQELDLSGVQVEPPRRRAAPWLERFLARWARHRRPSTDSRGPAVVSALLSLVPGLGHLVLGEPRRAAFALALYAATALVSLGGALPTLAEWILEPRWLPVSVHAWIMADAYATRLRQGGTRPGRPELLAVTLAALLLLFVPALARAPGADERLRLYVDLPVAGLQVGDVLRIDPTPRERLRVGNLVIHALPGGRVVGVVRGEPGSRVDWKEGVLRVDTRPVPTPEFPRKLPEARVTLQPGEYLVLSAGAAPETLRDLVYPAESIQGVAVEVVEPPDRRRILDTR